MLCDAMLIPLFVRLSLPETENANLDQVIQTLLLNKLDKLELMQRTAAMLILNKNFT